MKKICIKCNNHKKISDFKLRADTGKYRGECKPCQRAYFRLRNIKRAEKNKKQAKKRYLANKKYYKKKAREWKLANPDRVKIAREKERKRAQEKAIKNKRIKEIENQKELVKIDKKCIKCKKIKEKANNFYFRKDNNKYTNTCKNCKNKRCYERSKKNKELFNKYRKQGFKNLNKKEKLHIEKYIQRKISIALRGRLNKALKRNTRSGSAIRDLGCTIEQLKKHLEIQFYPHPETGEMMTWDNWTHNGWHIDHIKPLVMFDLTDRKQLLKACHYTNLQPLWAEENFRKNRFLNY